jgi:hypothetical protein
MFRQTQMSAEGMSLINPTRLGPPRRHADCAGFIKLISLEGYQFYESDDGTTSTRKRAVREESNHER